VPRAAHPLHRNRTTSILATGYSGATPS
jgi:hypothetical protein